MKFVSMMTTATGLMFLIGCQPLELEDYGGGLTEPVADRINDAISDRAPSMARRALRPK